MQFFFCLTVLFFQGAYSCQPGSSSSSTGKADELTLNISDVDVIPIEFVVYKKNDYPHVLAPKSAEDVKTNIKNRLQTAMSEVFRTNYDPSYRAGEAIFDVENPSYKPFECDELAFQDVTLTVSTTAKGSRGYVCLVSQPGYRTVIAVCEYDGTKVATDTTVCNTKPSTAMYKSLNDVVDKEHLTFGEAVKVSYDQDTSGARVQQLRSGFPKYKHALQNSMKSYMNMFCSGAFRHAKVNMNF